MVLGDAQLLVQRVESNLFINRVHSYLNYHLIDSQYLPCISNDTAHSSKRLSRFRNCQGNVNQNWINARATFSLDSNLTQHRFLTVSFLGQFNKRLTTGSHTELRRQKMIRWQTLNFAAFFFIWHHARSSSWFADPVRKCRRALKRGVEHKYFNYGIMTAILVNSLSMTFEHHKQVRTHLKFQPLPSALHFTLGYPLSPCTMCFNQALSIDFTTTVFQLVKTASDSRIHNLYERNL